MRTLITGGGGFVGQALVRKLAGLAAEGDEIVAADIAFGERPSHPAITYRETRLDEPGAIEALFDRPFDRIVHLATVAGVGSTDFDLGRATNLVGTQAVLEAARRGASCPRFVYSSSVGVFGALRSPLVNDETLPVPNNSYGTHKLIGELLVADYSRAGFIDGIALRLPGIIARPPGSTTMLSAFLNDVFYAARDGRPFDLPLAAKDASWVMSLRVLIANLVHAVTLPAASLAGRRYWTLPALCANMGELVAALAEAYGLDAASGIRFTPVEKARAMFAQAPVDAPGATALGFRGDGTVARFVANVIAANPALQPSAPAASSTAP